MSAETKNQLIMELASKLSELEGAHSELIANLMQARESAHHWTETAAALRGVLRSTLSYVEYHSGETGDSLRWQAQVIRRIRQALGDET